MTLSNDVMIVILVMAVAAALCRLSGFWFMRLVPITPRLQAALGAIPLAVMIGIIVPPVVRGGLAETIALVATLVVVRLGANDLVAVLVGMGSIAAGRAFL